MIYLLLVDPIEIAEGFKLVMLNDIQKPNWIG